MDDFLFFIYVLLFTNYIKTYSKIIITFEVKFKFKKFSAVNPSIWLTNVYISQTLGRNYLDQFLNIQALTQSWVIFIFNKCQG